VVQTRAAAAETAVVATVCPRCGSTGEDGGCKGCDPGRATTRYAKTPVTFGPWGRIAWTVGFLAIPAVAFTLSPVGVLFAVAWLLFLGPRALRDIWRPVRRNRLGVTSRSDR
jgi:hypothetical protein